MGETRNQGELQLLSRLEQAMGRPLDDSQAEKFLEIVRSVGQLAAIDGGVLSDDEVAMLIAGRLRRDGGADLVAVARRYESGSPFEQQTVWRKERIRQLNAEAVELLEEDQVEIKALAQADGFEGQCLALADNGYGAAAIIHYQESVGCSIFEAKSGVNSLLEVRRTREHDRQR